MCLASQGSSPVRLRREDTTFAFRESISFSPVDYDVVGQFGEDE